jgi:hypothetical protein
MFTNLSLVHKALKDAVAKKTLTLVDKNCVAEHLIKEHKIGQRQAFKAGGLAQRTGKYKLSNFQRDQYSLYPGSLRNINSISPVFIYLILSSEPLQPSSGDAQEQGFYF